MSRIAFRQWFRQLLRSAAVESRSTSSLRFESLEDRRLLATFAVLNTLDSGPGSLREAMIAANSTPGADQIEFAIASAAPHTINLASPLPIITEQVSIDATTQPGYTGAPIVELNGTSAGAGSGFVLRSPNNSIRGFVINRFSGSALYDQGSGIVIDGASAIGNLITSNYIGTDLSGTSASQNVAQGVLIVGGASGNIIGGDSMAQRNVISGNAIAGIRIADSPNNFVRGNYIGTDATGLADLGNAQDGIAIVFPASTGNIIGGNLSGQGNLISGNNSVGVNVSSPSNFVLGNVIGLSANGNVLGNSGFGIALDNSDNTVGSSSSTNVISGNGSGGIAVGANLLNTTIIGNRIGSSIDGTAARPNQGPGIRVQLTTTAASTTIGGSLPGESNLISGNNGNGIALNGNSTLVMGNRIGTAIDGATPLPNSLVGITVDGLLNTVGSNLDGNNDALEGNIIAFNANNGVYVSGNSNNIRSNSIRSNGANGVYIAGGEFNVVGGVSSASRNVIVGHSNSVGVRVEGTSAVNRAYRNSIAGNYIGVEADGFTVNENSVGVHLDSYSQENRIGQVIDGFNLTTSANTISGNLIGVNEAADIFTISQNAIYGNLIGTDASGSFRVRSYSVGMRPYGVVISGSGTQVENNTIGGFFASSFSSIGEGAGIYAYNAFTPVIAANRIGTSLDGLRALPNFFGIRTELSTEISILSNLVSGNLWHGMSVGGTGNQTNIEGNYVGLSSNGELLGNGGYGISSSATNTRIVSNVISGNGFGNAMVGNATSGGIRIESADGVIQNNLIGLDPTGRFARGNAKYGVFVNGDNILIGTNGDGLDDENEGNTISGQREIAITGGSPTLLPMKVRGNRIGTDISGTVASAQQPDLLGANIGRCLAAGLAGY